jgi:hypothetical protein
MIGGPPFAPGLGFALLAYEWQSPSTSVAMNKVVWGRA